MQGRNSNPQQKCKAKKGIEPKSETQNSLKKEILQLEMHLKDQQVVRGTLEKALGPGPATVTLQNESPMLKPATLLIREVAALALEIKHLEQYLLTLYRKAFEQQQQQLPSSKAHSHREAAPKLSSVSSRSSQQLDETSATKEPFQGGGASSRFVTQGWRPFLPGPRADGSCVSVFLVPAMMFALLPSLRPRDRKAVIRLRVYQKWEVRGGTDDDKIIHVDLILVDEKGNNMYAEIPTTGVECKSPLVEEGKIYIISRFRVSNAKDTFMPVPGNYMIEFSYYTLVDLVAKDAVAMPELLYHLTPFAQLEQCAGDQSRFTGLPLNVYFSFSLCTLDSSLLLTKPMNHLVSDVIGFWLKSHMLKLCISQANQIQLSPEISFFVT